MGVEGPFGRLGVWAWTKGLQESLMAKLAAQCVHVLPIEGSWCPMAPVTMDTHMLLESPKWSRPLEHPDQTATAKTVAAAVGVQVYPE